MATTYTHTFAGLVLGRVLTARRMPLAFWLLAAVLPTVPDFDVFSYRAYGSMLGHRGFTHSLTFAAALALPIAALTFRPFRVRFWPLFWLYFLFTASHAVLDAFTNGGFGVPLFWPFDDRRYGPYGPIQVSDIGFELPDPRTSRAVRTELLYVWLPGAVLTVGVTAYRWVRRRQPNAGRGGAPIDAPSSRAGNG